MITSYHIKGRPFVCWRSMGGVWDLYGTSLPHTSHASTPLYIGISRNHRRSQPFLQALTKKRSKTTCYHATNATLLWHKHDACPREASCSHGGNYTLHPHVQRTDTASEYGTNNLNSSRIWMTRQERGNKHIRVYHSINHTYFLLSSLANLISSLISSSVKSGSWPLSAIFRICWKAS